MEPEFRALSSLLQARTSGTLSSLYPDVAWNSSVASVPTARGRISISDAVHHDCLIIQSGIGPTRTSTVLSELLERIDSFRLILSSGFAGALSPALVAGDAIVVSSVRSNQPSTASEPHGLVSSLGRCPQVGSLGLRVDSLLTIEQPATDPSVKQRLHQSFQTAMCDMETYWVAVQAEKHAVPWLGLRVISDTARESLPGWIADLPEFLERKRYLRVFKLVATHPQDWQCLVRLAKRFPKLKSRLSSSTINFIRHVHDSNSGARFG